MPSKKVVSFVSTLCK